MGWNLTTSGAAIRAAGANANTTIISSGAGLLGFSDEADGIIECETRRKWEDNYTGLPTAIKNALDNVAASLIAMRIIAYDPTGYLTREADILLNVNDDRANKGLKILKDFKSNSLQNP